MGTVKPIGYGYGYGYGYGDGDGRRVGKGGACGCRSGNGECNNKRHDGRFWNASAQRGELHQSAA